MPLIKASQTSPTGERLRCIYPDIEVREFSHTVFRQGETRESPLVPRSIHRLDLFTNLRKKHRNKWYVQSFISNYESIDTPITSQIKEDQIDKFHSTVYFALSAGVVRLDDIGKHIFKLDSDQRDEDTRIRIILGIPPKK